MTTLKLTLESKNETAIKNILMLVSSFKGLKVKEKKIYNEAEMGLINALNDLNLYQKGELEFGDARELLKTL